MQPFGVQGELPMKCPRCGGENFNRLTGLALILNNVPERPSVGVIGIHCGKCNLLMLEVNPAALPENTVKHIENEWGGAAL
jgi:phage FluMu protein Com